MRLHPLEIERCAVEISNVFRGGAPLRELDYAFRPACLFDAYLVQRTLAEILDWKLAGWKAGMTRLSAQLARGMSEPVVGQLHWQSVYETESEIAPPDGNVLVEAEYCFILGRDMPATQRPYMMSDVKEAVSSVVPSLELVGSRFQRGANVDFLAGIADNCHHEALVLGAAVSFSEHLDILDAEISLDIDGGTPQLGTGREVGMNPLEVLLWIANADLPHSGGLKAGDLIATGACAKAIVSSRPGRVTADFKGLGSVNFLIAPAG